MEEELVEKLIIGITIALTSAWVTVKLSLSKFRTEKLWEQKVGAYTQIFEAFHHLKSFSEKHLYAEMRGRELPEETHVELRKKSHAAHKEISKYTDIGAFIFSKKFYERLKQFKNESEKISDEGQGWVYYLTNDQKITETCLNELINLAKEDLSKREK